MNDKEIQESYYGHIRKPLLKYKRGWFMLWRDDRNRWELMKIDPDFVGHEAYAYTHFIDEEIPQGVEVYGVGLYLTTCYKGEEG